MHDAAVETVGVMAGRVAGMMDGASVIDGIKSRVRRFIGRAAIGRPLVRLRFRLSRLSTRIMAIMMFPLVLFFVGLFSIDQYRTTLIQSEFTALERQGFTLARSLALAQADIDGGLARRRLSPETMNHLLPLVGYGTDLRARVFRHDGRLLADTARTGTGRAELRRRSRQGAWKRTSDYFQAGMRRAAGMIGNDTTLPVYRERQRQQAGDYNEVVMALAGEPARQLRQDARGRIVLSVAVPIQDLRLVRGALMVSISGGKIEEEIAEVNVVFIQLFGIVTLITIALSVWLARSITGPITYLASEADNLRRSRDLSTRMKRLPRRRDEIGKLSESLIDMTDELQQRMAATAGFAADVAHELKNPLSSLRSAAETISRISDPGQQQKLMNVILRDVSRLDRLITDISRSSRVDNEMASEFASTIDLRDLVRSFVEARRTTTGTHDLVADLADTPVHVKVQDGRIVQILDNLLGNAVSFAPEGSQISFHLGINAGGLAELAVQDRGPGIPPGRLQEVFNRFYTERPAGEAFGEHSGLGLSIAQQIARRYGGELVAANNDGARFTLTLPLADG